MPAQRPRSLKSRGRVPARNPSLTQSEVLVGRWIHLCLGLKRTQDVADLGVGSLRYTGFMTARSGAPSAIDARPMAICAQCRL